MVLCELDLKRITETISVLTVFEYIVVRVVIGGVFPEWLNVKKEWREHFE